MSRPGIPCKLYQLQIDFKCISSFPASIPTWFSDVNSETSRDKAVPPKIQICKGVQAAHVHLAALFITIITLLGRLDQMSQSGPMESLPA